MSKNIRCCYQFEDIKVYQLLRSDIWFLDFLLLYKRLVSKIFGSPTKSVTSIAYIEVFNCKGSSEKQVRLLLI